MKILYPLWRLVFLLLFTTLWYLFQTSSLFKPPSSLLPVTNEKEFQIKIGNGKARIEIFVLGVETEIERRGFSKSDNSLDHLKPQRSRETISIDGFTNPRGKERVNKKENRSKQSKGIDKTSKEDKTIPPIKNRVFIDSAFRPRKVRQIPGEEAIEEEKEKKEVNSKETDKQWNKRKRKLQKMAGKGYEEKKEFHNYQRNKREKKGKKKNSQKRGERIRSKPKKSSRMNKYGNRKLKQERVRASLQKGEGEGENFTKTSSSPFNLEEESFDWANGNYFGRGYERLKLELSQKLRKLRRRKLSITTDNGDSNQPSILLSSSTSATPFPTIEDQDEVEVDLENESISSLIYQIMQVTPEDSLEEVEEELAKSSTSASTSASNPGSARSEARIEPELEEQKMSRSYGVNSTKNAETTNSKKSNIVHLNKLNIDWDLNNINYQHVMDIPMIATGTTFFDHDVMRIINHYGTFMFDGTPGSASILIGMIPEYIEVELYFLRFMIFNFPEVLSGFPSLREWIDHHLGPENLRLIAPQVFDTVFDTVFNIQLNLVGNPDDFDDIDLDEIRDNPYGPLEPDDELVVFALNDNNHDDRKKDKKENNGGDQIKRKKKKEKNKKDTKKMNNATKFFKHIRKNPESQETAYKAIFDKDYAAQEQLDQIYADAVLGENVLELSKMRKPLIMDKLKVMFQEKYSFLRMVLGPEVMDTVTPIFNKMEFHSSHDYM